MRSYDIEAGVCQFDDQNLAALETSMKDMCGEKVSKDQDLKNKLSWYPQQPGSGIPHTHTHIYIYIYI